MTQELAPLAPDAPQAGAGVHVRGVADSFAVLCNWISAAAVAIIVVVNGVNVVGRYLFGAPLAWGEELMLYLMILAVFAGAVTVTWRQSHIRIEALVTRLARPARRAVSAAVGAIGVVLLTVLGVSSFDVVSLMFEFGQRSDALEVPMWVPQAVLTAGLFLIALMTALRLLLWEPEPQTHLGED